MHTPSKRFDRELASAALLAAIAGMVYLLIPARLYFGEGFKWALSEPGYTSGVLRFFHPHHLLYNPLGYAFHQAVSLVRPGISPMVSFRLMDSLFGAGGVFLFHEMVGRVTRSRAAAWVSATGFAFSWGYWGHSANVEVYVVSVFFLILGLRLSLPVGGGVSRSPGRWAVLGIVAGLAVLFHQSNVLFLAVPLTAALWSRDGRRTGGHLLVWAFLPAFVAVSTLPYLWVMLFHLRLQSVGAARAWLFMYGHQLDTYLGTSPSVVIHAVLSLAGAILHPGWYGLQAAGVSLSPHEIRMSKVVCLLFLVLLLLPAAIRFSKIRRAYGRSLPVLAAFALPYGLFFTFWDPGGYFFWIPMSIPVWILAAMATTDGGKGRPAIKALLALAILVLTLFTYNLLNGALPASDLDRVDDYRLTGFVTGHAASGDLVLLNVCHLDRIANFGGPMFFPYAAAFAPYEVEALLPALMTPGEPERLAGRIAETLETGRSVYYLDERLFGRPTDGGRQNDIRAFLTTNRWTVAPLDRYEAEGAYRGSFLYQLGRAGDDSP